MNIQGGGLSFEISGSNDKLLSVLNESKKAIQNFSTAAISGGKGIDRAFENAAAAIEKGFADIDRIVDTNKASLAKLQEEYKGGQLCDCRRLILINNLKAWIHMKS